MANKDAIVTLKVLLQATGSVKAMRFGLDLSVGEVIKEIRVKNEIGGKDHGLFVPPNPETGKKAFWLAKNRTLRYYGLLNNVRCSVLVLVLPSSLRPCPSALVFPSLRRRWNSRRSIARCASPS